MSDFVIIPDSSCDLTAELRTRFMIPDYVPGVVTFPDGHTQKADLDWTTTTPDEYFGSMTKDKQIIKTSAANPEEMAAIFEKHLAAGKDVLSVSLSSALSGTYNNAVSAAKILADKYPERKVVCIDSLRYSTALSLLIALASEKQTLGMSIDEVAAWMNENKHCIHQMGCMDDLFFLCRTGRVSNFKAFFGSLVGINPMADFNRTGLSEVIVKSKGKQTAFAVTVEYMKQTIIDPENQIIFIAHSCREKFAEKLREMIHDEIKPKEIIMNSVGMSCGASIGPGLVAAFYYGNEISEGQVKEKELAQKILDDITKK